MGVESLNLHRAAFDPDVLLPAGNNLLEYVIVALVDFYLVLIPFVHLSTSSEVNKCPRVAAKFLHALIY